MAIRIRLKFFIDKTCKSVTIDWNTTGGLTSSVVEHQISCERRLYWRHEHCRNSAWRNVMKAPQGGSIRSGIKSMVPNCHPKQNIHSVASMSTSPSNLAL